VAAHTARNASARARRPIIVEDAGLFIDALRGFPGVYSAYALKTIGLGGVVKLLKGSRSRRASFVSSVAYCEPGGEPEVFDGTVQGTISLAPRGSGGFGFDPIFLPSGGKKTFGELSIEEKCEVSHRSRALRKFAAWYSSRSPG